MDDKYTHLPVKLSQPWRVSHDSCIWVNSMLVDVQCIFDGDLLENVAENEVAEYIAKACNYYNKANPNG